MSHQAETRLTKLKHMSHQAEKVSDMSHQAEKGDQALQRGKNIKIMIGLHLIIILKLANQFAWLPCTINCLS